MKYRHSERTALGRIFALLLAGGGALALIGALLVVTGPESRQAAAQGTDGLQLIDKQPPANSHVAPQTTSVTLVYDRALDASAVPSNAVVLHGAETGRRVPLVSVRDSALTLTPTQPFRPGELVQVSATTATMALSGARPLMPTVWQFRTGVGDGDGVFIDAGQPLGWHDTIVLQAAGGDVDDDGDLDVMLAVPALGNELWLNDGQGNFVRSTAVPPNGGSMSVTLADLDGDGDLDAILGANVQPPRLPGWLWWNDGTGVFTDSGVIVDSEGGAVVASGDLDGDGSVDVIFRSADGSSPRVWLNEGMGHFNFAGSFGSSEYYMTDVALGDVDGDGDLDAVASSLTATADETRVWLNDGSGLFVDGGQALTGSDWSLVTPGDVDNDGDLDLLLLSTSSEGADHSLWLNDGVGQFEESGLELGEERVVSDALGDVEGDGDLDLFVNKEWRQGETLLAHIELWLNDGAGGFEYSGQTLGDGIRATLLLNAFNGDGALDLFGSPQLDEGTANIWFNQMLTITKQGPAQVGLGEPITYTLTLSNSSAITYTDLVITDALPAGAFYLRGGTLGTNGVVSWTLPSLAPGAAASLSLVVTASTDITNATYGVTSVHGVRAAGGQAVSTVVQAPLQGLAAYVESPVEVSQPTAFRATLASGTHANFVWAFGDGAQDVGAVVTHAYVAPGTYTAVVTGTNLVSTLTANVEVIVVPSGKQIFVPFMRWQAEEGG